MNIGSYIEKVPNGTTRRFKCPLCTGLDTLVITKEKGVVKYICHRSSCELHKGGQRPLLMSKADLHTALASRNALQPRVELKKEFELPTYWIQGIASKKAFQMLLNSNCIDAYTKGMFKVAYDPRLDRLVFLVQDKEGKIVGAVGRSLSGQSPKSYNYPDSQGIPFSCGKGTTAVIVEDCASACSISRIKDYTGIALLGTHLKTEYFFHIVNNYENIIIALDPDAYYKAHKMKRSIEYYKGNVLTWKIPRDFKNMTKEEILTFIHNKPL